MVSKGGRESLPGTYLASLHVIDKRLVDPVGGLDVLRVINLLGRHHGRIKVLQQATRLDRLVVDQDFVRVVRVDDQRVQRRMLANLGHGRVLQVLLLVFARNRVLVAEDEVHFIRCAALVRAKHDRERCLVGEILAGTQTLARVLGEELEVGTTAFEALLGLDFVLNDERDACRFVGVGTFDRDGFGKDGRDGVVGGLGLCEKVRIKPS